MAFKRLRLIQRRKALGYSQEALAEQVGCERTTVIRWDASGAGGLRRKAVVGQLNAVAESLNDHHPPVIAKRLFQVTAELAQLSGFLSAQPVSA
jgi:transcriptional regulator with XRE-family HTH domain